MMGSRPKMMFITGMVTPAPSEASTAANRRVLSSHVEKENIRWFRGKPMRGYRIADAAGFSHDKILYCCLLLWLQETRELPLPCRGG